MNVLSKREKIEFLLDNYREIFSIIVLRPGTGVDSNIPRFRLASHPSVRELIRSLGLLHDGAPADYRHLKAFYTAETRIGRVEYADLVPEDVSSVYEVKRRVYSYVERLVPRWVERHRVRRGLEDVVARFRGEPFIPDELLPEGVSGRDVNGFGSATSRADSQTGSLVEVSHQAATPLEVA